MYIMARDTIIDKSRGIYLDRLFRVIYGHCFSCDLKINNLNLIKRN